MMSAFISAIHNIVEVPAIALRQEKEIKDVKTRKKVVKLSPAADDKIAYVENSRENQQNDY